MLSYEESRKLTDKIIHFARPAQVEVLLVNHNLALTRYADSIITQNVSENNLLELYIKIIKNDKFSKVTLNQTDDASLKQAIKNCNYFVSVPGTELGLVPKQKYVTVNAYHEQTAFVSPAYRTSAIKESVIEAKNHLVNISGVFSNISSVITLSNSKGLFAHHPSTMAEFTCTALTDNSSGKAEKITRDINQIKSSQIAKIAVDKALKSKNPVNLNAGVYTVILEPAAAVELLVFMAFTGFGALSYQEGRSFMSGKIGKRIMGENISIVEDAYHPDILGMPFDFEGIPRKKVVLIDKGIARNVVYDRLTAKKGKCLSTGHGLPQPNPYGPFPTHLTLVPGNSSLKEMIASTEKGILITELHYTNLIDPMKMIITGMTRNGTFLIEKGNITQGIKNMRFTENILNMLSNVELISGETELNHGFVVPALKIRNFNFSSETKF
ncbi:MAG: metallopeptidase TldD-related protein [Planctomycetota bacterium]